MRNTFRKWYWTVRGLMKELGADLGIRESVARKPSDLGLFDDGKISEEWAADDLATFASQLGAVVLPWAS